MPLRLFDDMADIWKDFVRNEPTAQYLPFIVPVVVHHGDSAWRAETWADRVLDADRLEDVLH